MPPRSAPLLVRIPLAPVGEALPTARLETCPRCGSKGLNVHQRTWKRVKDWEVTRVPVVRYQCKWCGAVGRQYPSGVDAGRQSLALKQVSLVLYCLGLSYQGVRAVLGDLGCPLSTTSIRRTVDAARHAHPPAQVRQPLRLAPVGGGMLRGPSGLIALRLVRPSPGDRALEVEIAGDEAPELSWRLVACARWIG